MAVRRAATINDVAQLAGVSRQTVTRAVHDMPGISPATRQRVLTAARRLAYRPSRFGRGLVKPQLTTLGLLLEDLSNPYYPELASAVLASAAVAGWNVVMAERPRAVEPGTFLVDGFLSQVDAVISFTGAPLPEPAQGLGDLVVVEIDPGAHDGGRARAGHADHGVVELDREAAVALAASHLAERGARTAVVFDHARGSARAASFLAHLRGAGVQASRVVARSTDLAGGVGSVQDLLRDRTPPDAIVAFNDAMAFGVLRALRLEGVEVPGDVRVVGVDGLAIGQFVTPRLSTVALDMPALARTALDLVLAMHAGDVPRGGPLAYRRVAHRFDVGESS